MPEFTTIVIGALGALIGGLVTLSLNLTKVLSDSIAASQKPRLEAVRQAVISFNEGLFKLTLIAREQGLARKAEALNKEYGVERFEKYEQVLDEGLQALSNSCGFLLSIGQCGMADDIRDFQNAIFELIVNHRSSGEQAEFIEFRKRCDNLVIEKRNFISGRLADLLEEESRLAPAINRYFKK